MAKKIFENIINIPKLTNVLSHILKKYLIPVKIKPIDEKDTPRHTNYFLKTNKNP